MKKYINIILILSLIFSSLIAEQKSTVIITLEDFLKRVEENSKDLKLLEKELDYAEANKKEAYSTALPKIASQGGYTRNLNEYYSYLDFGMDLSALGMDGFSMPSKIKANYHNSFEINTQLQQTLFSSQVGAALKAAKQYEKMTEKIYTDGKLQTTIGAKKLFYQTLLLKKVWEVNQKSEENALENYENIKSKFEAGTVSELDLYQAEVNWRNTLPQVTQAKKNYELAMNNMKEMAGIELNQPITLSGNFDTHPQRPKIPNLESVLSLRPDYNRMKWQSRLMKTNIRAQKAAYFPSLQGTITHSYSSMSDEFKMERENNVTMVGLNLTIPIWTGGYTGAQVQKASIDYEKSKIQLQKSEEAIARELDDLDLKLSEAENRILSASTTLRTAEKGMATQLELKDARLAYSQAELGYYAAVLDYLIAYFDYELAIGHTD
jgi:outer membrane protein TolC